MNLIYLILFILLNFFSSGAVFAQKEEKIKMQIAAGINLQKLDWSIAGNARGENPNIYSELIWDNLSGNSVTGSFMYQFYKQVNFKVEFSQTFIRSGNVSDQDYAADNRQNRIFAAFLESNKGYSWYLDNSISFPILKYRRLSLFPQLGYIIFRQSLYLADEAYTVGNESLNSNYKTKWEGPKIGLDFHYFLTRKMKLNAGIQYHKLDYSAAANWNLIEEFSKPKSFIHHAKGFAFGTNFSAIYEISKRFSANIIWHYLKSTTHRGVDQLYLADGDDVLTQLNGVNYRSKGTNLGLSYNF